MKTLAISKQRYFSYPLPHRTIFTKYCESNSMGVDRESHSMRPLWFVHRYFGNIRECGNTSNKYSVFSPFL